MGPPTAVAIGVTEVFWHDRGTALAFYSKDADGTFLGVHNLETGRGKDVVRFAEGTNVHYEAWLPNHPIYVIATSRAIVARKAKHWAVTVVDARTLTSKEVWSNDYPLDAEVSVDIKPSPSLDHAIIEISDPQGRAPVVLLNGGVNAVFSRDLAAAWEQGASFAGWSLDGTAYFRVVTEVANPQQSLISDVVTTWQGAVELTLKVGEGGLLSDIPLVGFLWRATPVAPEAGTPVYELMPNNAALRPVPSKGPYVGPAPAPHVVFPKAEDSIFSTSTRRDGGGALWLVRLTGDENQPFGSDGILISPFADRFWMCDDGNWVAYVTGGALFVRRISYGGEPYSRALVGGG
jgi:hypothetical protein